MRPVNKESSPYVLINDYHDAEPYLEKKIGAYCSYCELPIKHTPNVEHKESKNSGGLVTDWENLLLACVYCNSRKKEKIKKGQSNLSIWPDENNTFLAYNYENGMPTINQVYLMDIGKVTYDKAKMLFDIVGLNNIPTGPKDKDKRWKTRIEVLGIAESLYNDWLSMKDTRFEDRSINSIIKCAISSGFFSVWMLVFKNEKKIKLALIESFIGTSKECFDADGNPTTINIAVG